MPAFSLLDYNNPGWDGSQSYSNSSSTVATLQQPKPPSLPPWLSTNPDDLISELHTMYGKIPQLFNPSAIAKPYNDAIASTKGIGGQIANNASMEAIARGGITGGQVNSGMVKAQSMLPVYDTTNKLEVDKSQAIAQQTQAQGTLMSQIAQQMGNLRTNYLANLGQLHNTAQGQTNSFTTAQESQNFQQQQADRQYRLTLQQLAQRSSAATGGGGGGGFNPLLTPGFDPGYIPNSGPIRGSSINPNMVYIGGGGVR